MTRPAAGDFEPAGRYNKEEMVMVLEGLYYSPDHEWVKAEGKSCRVGITHYAQEELGSVVYVELPAVGSRVAAGDTLGVLESVKAASEYYAPVSGKVTAVNEDLLETPGLINDDPYVRGWIVEMELEDRAQLDGLLTPEGYRKLLAGEGI